MTILTYPRLVNRWLCARAIARQGDVGREARNAKSASRSSALVVASRLPPAIALVDPR
jgi:hypothetical protein